jgi:FkbM family methyltransferase
VLETLAKRVVASTLTLVAGALPASLLDFLFRLRWRGRLPPILVRTVQRLIRHRDGAILRGPAAGLRFNPGDSNVSYILGLAEPLVQAALARHLGPGMVFYDVGANVGFLTLLGARLVGRSGAVIAFEPHPGNAAALRHNVALNGFDHVVVFEQAAAAQPGSGTLFFADQTTLATLVQPPGSTDGGAAIEVALVAIDELVTRHVIPPPAVVKIDVEGAELDVLRGMRETIRRHRPMILCEVHSTNRAFAELMREMEYSVQTLGAPVSIEDAPANAQALAFPR